MAKVVRVLLYEGDDSFVRGSLIKAGVPLNGIMSCISSVIVVVDAPCLICGAHTTNLSIICDTCLEERADIAREIEEKLNCQNRP
jgi:hypothetical protein